MTPLDQMIDAVKEMARVNTTLEALKVSREKAAARLLEIDSEIKDLTEILKSLAKEVRTAWKANPLKEVDNVDQEADPKPVSVSDPVPTGAI